MQQFITDVQIYPFLQHALLTGILASIACGIIGTYVVVRRISYIADGIAHAVLGGMGAALYIQKVHHMPGVLPMHGAIVTAILAAIIIGLVSLWAKQREDNVISAIWAVGMAIGIIFISRTPGYNEDLMSYLFGNILLVSSTDLWTLAGLDFVILLIGVLFYNQFLAVCFDDEFARLRGLNVEFFYLLLLCLTALTVVVLSTVVGIVMVIALLTLPIGIAALYSGTLWRMMILSAILCALFTTSGLALSYVPDYPAGAATIIIAGAAYLAATTLKWVSTRGRS
ncbi:metal ABC transporter permease [Desulfomonile tiedjei]|uniref:ABC-type Mn2+/Zn2+ transport system, permease component n=1 Tax=Desulfomonile tiedjei (strain ATCC 49306 / DSM 6799 / DCB-1) TaxID=706587 RepID=I4C9C6_DESTA|nr:metal ABC transporter permease [Desulfomonile tiedjei]AFM26167.1 ABC-type Mn2+/Zn2+ transport system, permease component [Desulfomonile tiedjei DSM 6799]